MVTKGPKIYGDIRSPCVRASIFTAKILNIEFEFVPIDLLKGENLTPEFLKINPLHTVPVLDDNGFILTDSHAIMIYLAEKYGKGNSLYPLDFGKRAKINQFLFFESVKIFGVHIINVMPILRRERNNYLKELNEEIKSAYGYLNTVLKDTKYLTGNEITLADITIWTTVTNIEIYLPVDEKEYPNLAKYLKLMDNLPYREMNQEGSKDLKNVLEKLTQ